MRIPIADSELVLWVGDEDPNDWHSRGFKPVTINASHIQDHIRSYARNYKITTMAAFRKSLPFRSAYYRDRFISFNPYNNQKIIS